MIIENEKNCLSMIICVCVCYLSICWYGKLFLNKKFLHYLWMNTAKTPEKRNDVEWWEMGTAAAKKREECSAICLTRKLHAKRFDEKYAWKCKRCTTMARILHINTIFISYQHILFSHMYILGVGCCNERKLNYHLIYFCFRFTRQNWCVYH